MTNIVVTKLENHILVVDSRLLAEGLGIEHRAFLQTLKTHEVKLQSKFGQVTFQMQTVTNSVKARNQIKFALLTEIQATAACTLARNTPEVVDFKFALVEAFFKAREALQLGTYTQWQPKQPTHTLPDPYLESYKQTLLTEVSKVETPTDLTALMKQCQEWKGMYLSMHEHLEMAVKIEAQMKERFHSHAKELN